MSQSLVTSGSATLRHPLVMKGSFFSTKLYGHHQVSELNMSKHFLGSNKAFEILANLGLDLYQLISNIRKFEVTERASL